MESAQDSQGRILLVDDESAILRTFRYCLEDEGYSVATANSAAQADTLLQRQVFDLCFLDLRLGEDNGLDVLAQMRIQAPWMRVVIVTAHSAIDTAVDAIQAGAADYLVKPCSPDQLRLATANVLAIASGSLLRSARPRMFSIAAAGTLRAVLPKGRPTTARR